MNHRCVSPCGIPTVTVQQKCAFRSWFAELKSMTRIQYKFQLVYGAWNPTYNFITKLHGHGSVLHVNSPGHSRTLREVKQHIRHTFMSRPQKTTCIAITPANRSMNNGLQLNIRHRWFFHSYRASWYYQSFFVRQLTHKWIVLKTILKFTLKFTSKQLRHVSVLSRQHQEAHWFVFPKVTLLRQ
jgi:hypothetical protein